MVMDLKDDEERESIRMVLAGVAMHAMLSAKYISTDDDIAVRSFRLADTMIAAAQVVKP